MSGDSSVTKLPVVGEYRYKDDKGTLYTEKWEITDEMFCDSNALTQEQITEICNDHSPELVEKGFDIAIYNACQARGFNPKIVLATLQWE